MSRASRTGHCKLGSWGIEGKALTETNMQYELCRKLVHGVKIDRCVYTE